MNNIQDFKKELIVILYNQIDLSNKVLTSGANNDILEKIHQQFIKSEVALREIHNLLVKTQQENQNAN